MTKTKFQMSPTWFEKSDLARKTTSPELRQSFFNFMVGTPGSEHSVDKYI
jgi:hypothetical protein